MIHIICTNLMLLGIYRLLHTDMLRLWQPWMRKPVSQDISGSIGGAVCAVHLIQVITVILHTYQP